MRSSSSSKSQSSKLLALLLLTAPALARAADTGVLPPPAVPGARVAGEDQAVPPAQVPQVKHEEPPGPQLSLESAVSRALRNNLSLKIQSLEPEIAKQDVRIAKSAFDVNFQGSAGVDRRSQPNVEVWDDTDQKWVKVPNTNIDNDNFYVAATKRLSTGADITLSTSANRSAANSATVSNSRVVSANEEYDTSMTLRVVQPLLQGAWSGVNLARLRQAQSMVAEQQLRVRSEAADVTLSVEQAYWNLSHAYARRDLLQSSVDAAQQLVDEMQARQERGLATPIDLLQAQAELAQRKQDLIVAQDAIAEAGDTLASAMGGLLGTGGVAYLPRVADLPQGAIPLKDFDSVWPRVLTEDLDSQIQEQAIARNDLDRLIAADIKKPRLDAYAQGSLLGADGRHLGSSYKDAAGSEGHDWQAGVQFSMPWGAHEGLARSRQADLILEQAKTRLIQIRQDLYQRARAAWRGINSANQRLVAARTQLDFEEGAYAQARARYDRGLTSFRELLDAQRDLDTSRLVYIDVLRDLAVARSVLARLDGSLFQTLDFSHNPAPASGARPE